MVEHVMGIPVGIDVRDAIEPGAIEAAFDHLRWVDATFSTYRPQSELNAAAQREAGGGTAAPVGHSPELRAVLGRCEELKRRTGGWFDVRATGRLDPSGFVKGWALEGAAAILLAAGARNMCLHAGGDVLVRGERAPGAPWRVGIQHPSRRDRVAAVLAAHDLAVATSGAYERGEHIVDPRTGRPPQGVLSVTVAGPDLGTADAYSTAAFAMGVDGPAWTATLDGYSALTILADGRVLSTPGLDRQL
jgi:FAD:protein FMN transferase